MVYETLFEMASAVWGPNKPLRAIDREACRELLDLLRWLPSNPTKRFPKLTLVQAAQMAKAKGLTSTLSPASVNGYLCKLRAMLNFAVREELLDRNPACGLAVVDPVRSRDKRLPFSTEQLRLIFSAPLYTGCVDDWFGYRSGAATPSLLIREADNLTIEYAPFDHIERDAELVIVGLTPGRQQAANALETLAMELGKGTPTLLALERAKRTASFSGPMRSNLLNMLDAIGVPALFGRQHAAEFFSDAKARVHFTSTLRYPVFIDGENYSGSPKPLSQPLLREMIDTHLVEEAKALPKAIWVPLGQHAEAALVHLSSSGHLDRAKILAGFPHPSGANAERIAYFLGRKARQDLSAKTNPDTLDQQKAALVNQVRRLR